MAVAEAIKLRKMHRVSDSRSSQSIRKGKRKMVENIGSTKSLWERQGKERSFSKIRNGLINLRN